MTVGIDMPGVFHVTNASPQAPFFSLSVKLDRRIISQLMVVVSARCAGTTATFDQLNKCFGLLQLPVISSQYWNLVHGMLPDEVRQDSEGMQTMRTLARDMAYHLKCREAAQNAGVPLPKRENITLKIFMGKLFLASTIRRGVLSDNRAIFVK